MLQAPVPIKLFVRMCVETSGKMARTKQSARKGKGDQKTGHRSNTKSKKKGNTKSSGSPQKGRGK